MNYEQGLSRLKRQVKKIKHDEITKEFLLLEKQLLLTLNATKTGFKHNAPIIDIDTIIHRLNIISHRILGVSFLSLCNETRINKLSQIKQYPLSKVLLLIMIILSLPPLTVVIAVSESNRENQKQIAEIRQQIEEIDLFIGNNVTSFFYLSRTSPCDENITERLELTDFILFELGPAVVENQAPQNSSLCAWEYKITENGELIAKDIWISFARDSKTALQRREYYQSSEVMIARDLFNISEDTNCFRLREYIDSDEQVIMTECYSESGELTSSEFSSLVPMPPMLYWFFYR